MDPSTCQTRSLPACWHTWPVLLPCRSRARRSTTLLWGSHFDIQARQNLRQALFRLRRALGQDALIADGEEISLAPGVVDCDVARFEALIREGRRASLVEAVDLYKEPFLVDVAITEEAWSDWVASERQRLEGLALDAMVRFGEIELAAVTQIKRSIPPIVRWRSMIFARTPIG